MELNVMDADEPRVIIANLDTHGCIMIGQQVGYFFGPFNKAVSTTVKILLIAHIQRFGLCFKPIKIEVENPAIPADVFVNDRECRAGGRLINPHLFAQGFDERSFTGTHIAIK